MGWIKRSWQDWLDSEELVGWVGFSGACRMGWIQWSLQNGLDSEEWVGWVGFS